MQGISSCTAKSLPVTIQEAMLKAAIKARDFGYNHFLFLCDSRRSVQVTNRRCTPSWQERILIVGRLVSFSTKCFNLTQCM